MNNEAVTKAEVIAAIQECAQRLGHVPSVTELRQLQNVSKRAIRRCFGNYRAALEACGLERKGAGHKLNARDLFLDWAAVARRTGKAPSIAEYELHGKHCGGPLARLYGSWTNVPAGLMGYVQKEGLEEEWRDVMEIIARHLEDGRRTRQSVPALGTTTKPRILRNDPLYGEALQHPAISHAPTNENGVIFLFGIVAQELGFKVQRIQAEFPDCEAMRQVEPGVWQRVRVEFEFESRNFLRHLHEVAQCDVIVCWKNNWADCPLEVVELREVVRPQ